MSDVKIWLVTGASSGFGRAMTEYLLGIGNKVIATLRKPEALADLAARHPPTQLLVVKVDVTNTADISATSAKAERVFGRIDVVFNNAGVSFSSKIESLDSTGEPYARNMMNINFRGAARVSKEAVRFFREIAAGLLWAGSCRWCRERVLQRLKVCFRGSLAAELDPTWSIKVTILEPGPYRTEILGHNHYDVPQHPVYADPDSPTSQVRKFLAGPELFDGDVGKAAIVIEKFTRLEDAPIRFPLHRDVVSSMRDKAKVLSELADTYESWTKDFYHDK